MKLALCASLVNGHWMDRLPWVLLALRSAPKEDMRASAAELVLGQPLRVPGEFLFDSFTFTIFHHQMLCNASHLASVLLPQTYIPRALQSASCVFIWHDGHHSSFRPPSDRPFRVLEAGLKSFVVDRGGRTEQ